MEIRNILWHFHGFESWVEIGIFMRIYRDLKTTLKRRLWSWGRTLCWIQLVRSLFSDVQMRWFQLEDLDLEVYYIPSKYGSNPSYESKVTMFLPKGHNAEEQNSESGWTASPKFHYCLAFLADHLALNGCSWRAHLQPKRMETMWWRQKALLSLVAMCGA